MDTGVGVLPGSARLPLENSEALVGSVCKEWTSGRGTGGGPLGSRAPARWTRRPPPGATLEGRATEWALRSSPPPRQPGPRRGCIRAAPGSVRAELQAREAAPCPHGPQRFRPSPIPARQVPLQRGRLKLDTPEETQWQASEGPGLTGSRGSPGSQAGDRKVTRQHEGTPSQLPWLTTAGESQRETGKLPNTRLGTSSARDGGGSACIPGPPAPVG